MSQAQIALRELAEGENRVEFQLGAEALRIAPDEVELSGEVTVALEVYREGQTLQVKGAITGTVDAECSRCARRFRAPFDAALFVIAKWSPGGTDPGEYGDDETVIYHDGHVLDLADPIRQLVILAQPMAWRCREDCPGLCPTCGADLSREPCRCEPPAHDLRWRVIDDLLKKSGPPTGS
jgi:uncharacterized protein